MSYREDYFDDYYDYDGEPEDFEDDDGDPCDHCGPWCKDWGGDNICMVAIEQQVKAEEAYKQRYVAERMCPICNKSLTCYQIPDVDDLWVWPGNLNPMIAVGFMGIYDTPKGIIHQKGNVYHVWTYGGEYREEKLIQPLGKGLKL